MWINTQDICLFIYSIIIRHLNLRYWSVFCSTIVTPQKVKWSEYKCKVFSSVFSVWSQAPSDRQLRYKEKVTELRRKRNSGLNKEQKEKYMVKVTWLCLLYVKRISKCIFPYYILSLSSFVAPPPGAPSKPRDKPGATAGEHHQRLRPRAVQESAGTCLGRPCKRENSSSSPSLTLFSFPFFFVPLPLTALFLFFSVSVRKPSSAATGAVWDIFGSLDSHFLLLCICVFLLICYFVNHSDEKTLFLIRFASNYHINNSACLSLSLYTAHNFSKHIIDLD